MKDQKVLGIYNMLKACFKKKLKETEILKLLTDIYDAGHMYGKMYSLDSDKYKKETSHHSCATVPQNIQAMELIGTIYKHLKGNKMPVPSTWKFEGIDVNIDSNAYHFDYTCSVKEKLKEGRMTFWYALYILYFMGWVDAYDEYYVAPIEEPRLDMSKIKPETLARVREIWNSIQ